ncbi:hypothetical protein GCM10007968_17990 [Sporolactobacillus putidus]|uniref:Uncharacterized protein n=2 Tax=Sporolactobacillus putidus TaxID=492735 RepID=A0A917W2J7_9BACL|nr:hypothetical protein GCM10007968_17990 [Sporolactobacillus putidus]
MFIMAEQHATTDKFLETTDKQSATTDKPLETTDKQRATTDKLLETTDRPILSAANSARGTNM